MSHFYADLEEWGADQKLFLIVIGFRSCDEAARSIGIRVRGGVITTNVFPHYRVPLEEDHDRDGLLSEGFVTVAQ